MATAALAFTGDAALAHECQRYKQLSQDFKALRVQLAQAKSQLGQHLAAEHTRLVGSETTPERVGHFKAWLRSHGLTVSMASALIRSTQPKPARVTPAISLRGQTLTFRGLNPRHCFFLHQLLNNLVETGETKFIFAEVLITYNLQRLKHRLQRAIADSWHQIRHTFTARDCRKLSPVEIPFGVLSEKP